MARKIETGTAAKTFDQLRTDYRAAGLTLREATAKARRDAIAAQEATWRAQDPDNR